MEYVIIHEELNPSVAPKFSSTRLKWNLFTYLFILPNLHDETNL